MRNINKVILIGNVTREPELRQTANGQNVATFTIATNRAWITRDGRKQTSSEYHDVVAWARLADLCHQHIKKGKLVHIEGYLKTRSWDTPEGIKKFKTEVIIDDLIMLEKRERTEGDEMQSTKRELASSETSAEQMQHEHGGISGKIEEETVSLEALTLDI